MQPDDRFVLKEMNSRDMTIFEPFAPKYFEYIDRCQQQQQPTLLAKIFGVFRVSVKKKEWVFSYCIYSSYVTYAFLIPVLSWSVL